MTLKENRRSNWIKAALLALLLSLLICESGFCQTTPGQTKGGPGVSEGQTTASTAFIDSLTAEERFWLAAFVLILSGLGVWNWKLSREIRTRKQAEKALLESEAIFNEFMEHSPIYVFFKDENIRTIRLSKNFETLSGKPLEELIGKTMDELFSSELAKSIIADDIRILKEDRVINIEEELNGRFYTTIKFPIYIDGKPRYLAGYAIDITERKKAEDELRQSAGKLREVQEMTRLGHWSWDVTTGAVEWSDEVYKIFHLDPKEFTPDIDSIMEFSPWPEDHERDKELIRLAIESREKGSYEQRFIRPDKSVGYYYSTYQGHYDEKGALVSIVGSVMDITERKIAEAAKTRLLRILESSLNEIYVFNAESLVFEYVNSSALHNLGYTMDTMLGMTPFDIKPEFTEASFRKAIAPLFAHKKDALIFTTVHRRADGSVYPVEVHLQLVEIEDQQVFLSVILDITESRKLQDQLRHAQKLEGIGQLAGGIAHDFNNILNAVIGYAGLIQRHMEKGDPVRNFAEEITAAGLRGAALTRQILAFSRRQALDMKAVNINDIVQNIQQMLRRLVREDISIKLKLADEKLVVLADADQIDQVLINLTTNARDSMPGGGTIDISTSAFVMDESFIATHGYGSPGNFALITFSDSGCGMEAETRSRIFDPFFTTKETGKGTGLGLSVVHGILTQHNGHVNVYSEPGKGSIFYIYLPLTGVPVDKSEEPQSEESRVGTETILIAEDDASLRMLTQIILKHSGYKVIEAVDGEDAIQKFAGNSDIIDLIILDGIMPKKNGKEALEAIRKLCPDIKAVFMSGYVDDSFTYKDLSDKGAAFIRKPVKPDDLLRLVRKTLDAT
jgi:two-component system, cell cycle sensor histidine kinase and response regulator CckA